MLGLLAIPLVLMGAGQVFFIAHPIVLVDLICAVVIAAVAVRLTTPTNFWASPLMLAGLAGATALIVSVVARTEWPLASAWAGTMLAAVQLAQAKSSLQLRLAVLTGAVVLLSPLTRPWEEWVLLLPVTAAVVLPAMAVALVVRGQRTTAAVQNQAARERERRIISEELHDVVAHEITGIIVLAQAMRPAVDGGPAAPGLERIEASGKRALEQIRTLVTTLQQDGEPGPGQLEGAAPTTLREVAEAAERSTDGLPGNVRISSSGLDHEVPAQVALAAQRILSESLTNVRRHALRAQTVDIRIDVNDQVAIVEVSDDALGAGLESAAPQQDSHDDPRDESHGLGPGAGTGLAAMQERVHAVGGQLRTGRRASGVGWRVLATLPLQAALPHPTTERRRPTRPAGGDVAVPEQVTRP